MTCIFQYDKGCPWSFFPEESLQHQECLPWIIFETVSDPVYSFIFIIERNILLGYACDHQAYIVHSFYHLFRFLLPQLLLKEDLAIFHFLAFCIVLHLFLFPKWFDWLVPGRLSFCPQPILCSNFPLSINRPDLGQNAKDSLHLRFDFIHHYHLLVYFIHY